MKNKRGKCEMLREIDKDLLVNISGPAMEIDDGYDLKYLVDTLNGFENIIEKTYLFSVGKTRMNVEDRENLKVILKNPTKGSFEAEIGIQVIDLTLALAPMIAQNGTAIWGAIKNTYEYLTLIIDSKKKGEKIMIENGEGGIIQIINGNDNTATAEFPSYVEGLAEKIAPEFEKMTKNIDKDKIEAISITDKSTNKNIVLDDSDKKRFTTENFLTEDLYTIKGQITISNSNSFTGKIYIYENDYGIHPDEYNFTVDPHLANKDFLRENFLTDEKYICRLKLRTEPSNIYEEELVGVNITSVEEVA